MASFLLSLLLGEAVYYQTCPELESDSGLGLQGNPLMLRIPVENAETIHYRAQVEGDYAIFKAQRHLSSLTFRLQDYAGRLVNLKGKPVSLLLTFSVD